MLSEPARFGIAIDYKKIGICPMMMTIPHRKLNRSQK